MSAYVIAMVRVEDREVYRKYTERTPATIARHGGRFLARGGAVRTLEGEPYDDRLVLLEFPTLQAATEWFNDPDYQTAAVFRRAASTGRFFLIDGERNTSDPDPKV